MAMTARFSEDSILDAAASLVLINGVGHQPAMTEIARHLSAPSGSIYHRFRSHQELLTRLWLRSVRRFHRDYLAAGRADGNTCSDAETALLSMARSVVKHVRDQPANAASMTLFSQRRLLTLAPAFLVEEVSDVNTTVHARLGALCEQRFGTTDDHHRHLVRVAAIALPYGLIRPHVGHHVPDELGQIVTAASSAVLTLGDRPTSQTA